jgi:ribosome-binding protein aMBF1 (putative translation factor)
VLHIFFDLGAKYGIYAILKIWLLCHFALVNNTRDIKFCKAFGENLRRIRKKKGLTMMDLAHEADVEYSQIAKIERGISNPTISTVKLLASALKIASKELFDF